jgi:hypothetical protein
LSFGSDYFITKFDEDLTPNRYDEIKWIQSTTCSFFTEADILFSKKLAAKVGLRASYNDLLEESAISPNLYGI